MCAGVHWVRGVGGRHWVRGYDCHHHSPREYVAAGDDRGVRHDVHRGVYHGRNRCHRTFNHHGTHDDRVPEPGCRAMLRELRGRSCSPTTARPATAPKEKEAAGPDLRPFAPGDASLAAAIVDTINNGGGGMPAFSGRFDGGQMTALVAYVLGL